MKFGYARISKEDQFLDHQIDLLINAGCEEIFTERLSGKRKNKPEQKKLLSKIRKDDVLIVYSLNS